MRKSFDGLQVLVSETMQLDTFAEDLFVFANRLRNQTTFYLPVELRWNAVLGGVANRNPSVGDVG
jgi:hypothetical protein